MKTTLITLVLLAFATTAHAQAGTGMLAPWNANAHPINGRRRGDDADAEAALVVVAQAELFTL